MHNYFPIISRKLTKAIIPYSKSEATLQIASANGKNMKNIGPSRVATCRQYIAKGVAMKVPHCLLTRVMGDECPHQPITE